MKLIQQLIALSESTNQMAELDEKSFEELCKAINSGMDWEVYNCEGFDSEEAELLGGGGGLSTLFLEGEFEDTIIKINGFRIYGAEDDDEVDVDQRLPEVLTIDLNNQQQVKSQGKKIGQAVNKALKAEIKQIHRDRN